MFIICVLLLFYYYYSLRILSTCFIYPLSGFKYEYDELFYYILSFTCVVLYSTYLGQLLSFITPSLQVALLAGIAIIALMAVLSGYSLPYNHLHLIFKYLYWINPVQYYYTGVAASQLYCTENVKENCAYVFDISKLKFISINDYIYDIKGIDYSIRWYNIIGIIFCCIFWRFPFLLSLSKIRYQSK